MTGRRRLWTLVGLAVAGLLRAQDPDFALSFEAPASLTGAGGSAVAYAATGKLTTTGLAPSDPGAQGWSLSILAEGGTITGLTTAGTIVGSLFDGGFNKTELTSGAGNEGGISAVVLSFLNPVTLPPTGTVDIIQVSVAATVPQPVLDPSGDPSCEPLSSTVRYVNGRRGSGQPVDNKVTWKGSTFLPALGSSTTTICPIVVKPLVLRMDLDGGFPTDPDATPVPWTLVVPVGSGDVTIETGVVLTSNIPGTGGTQGWSISVLTEPCFGLSGATTAGTAVDAFFNGGFKKTELVDPGKNSGQQGVVSAVVLSFTSPATLPETGDSLLLKVSGSIDASGIVAGGDRTPPCGVRLADASEPGLRGSGQPVKTAVTVEGQTRSPATRGSLLSLEGERQGRFIRGNANDDAKNDIADAVWIVNELFRLGRPTLCRDAADANDDGAIDLSDALYIIGYQFQGQSPPPTPFPGCGPDPDGADDGLSCDVTQTGC